MLHSLVLLLGVAAVHGHRIVGGENASIEEFPYQVSIEHFGKHLCGGSIIGPTKILTAAHCTRYYRLRDLKVRAGSSLREQDGHLIALSKKHEHSDFNKPMFNNDVGVLTLATPLVYSDKIQPILLSDEDVPVGSVGYLTGWGSIAINGDNVLPERLQKLLVAKSSNERCEASFPWAFISDTMVCYGGEDGKSGCGNDSGGPVVVDGKQVGVVSSGIKPCDGSNPILYAKVSYFKDVIETW